MLSLPRPCTALTFSWQTHRLANSAWFGQERVGGTGWAGSGGTSRAPRVTATHWPSCPRHQDRILSSHAGQPTLGLNFDLVLTISSFLKNNLLSSFSHFKNDVYFKNFSNSRLKKERKITSNSSIPRHVLLVFVLYLPLFCAIYRWALFYSQKIIKLSIHIL